MNLAGTVHLIAGDSAALQPLLAMLADFGIETKGNPDLYIREYASFGVDEARELSQRASSRAVVSDHRIFVVVTPGMTSEAQNALLKTLEEPSGDALFFFIVPSPQILLPTLRSRAQILNLGFQAAESPIDVGAFIKAAPGARLEMLKPLFGKEGNEKRDTAGSLSFLSALERALKDSPQRYHEGIEALYRARKYIGDGGSLAKALLEQVALLV